MTKPPALGRNLDDLQSMAIFVRVVETGSLSAAARTLGATPSAVSKRVTHLEELLGVRLLERTTRALAPTEAGQVFYERCARILREVEDAELAVTEMGSKPKGTIRVTALTMLGEEHLGPLLGAFAARYPDLRVDVDLRDQRMNLVEEGYDLGIRGMEIGAAPDSSLIARKLATVGRLICGAPSYLARRGLPTSLEDLAQHDCLHYTPIPLHREWSFKTPDGTHTVPVTPRLQINSVAALRGAAIAGCGLISTSRLNVGQAIQDGALVPVLAEHESAEFGLFAVYPAGKQVLPKVKVFVDFLLEELSPRLACPPARSEGTPSRLNGEIRPA
jgi:DNA-binding transcriptional LysR family regulator